MKSPKNEPHIMFDVVYLPDGKKDCVTCKVVNGRGNEGVSWSETELYFVLDSEYPDSDYMLALKKLLVYKALKSKTSLLI